MIRVGRKHTVKAQRGIKQQVWLAAAQRGPGTFGRRGLHYFLKSPRVIHGLQRKLPYNLLPVKGNNSHQGNFYSASAMWETLRFLFPKALFEGFTVVEF